MASDNLEWFEFLLNPSLLEKHLNQPNPDPSAINLIIQFIFHGMKRNENIVNEGEIVDPTTQEITEKKRHILTVLPLQVAGFLNWNLNLFQEKLPLHILDSLLVALMHETLEEYCNPASHATLDTGPLLPHQLFVVALYHRYAISSLVKAKLPSKPIKVSNVPIPGQQDPMQESREVQDGIIGVLERGAENSTRILEQLLTAGEVRSPTMQSFSLNYRKSYTDSSNHFWPRCKLVHDEEFKYQIHYELGNYHFLLERFGDALHHFTEALQLLPEIGSSAEFCHVEENKLKGFYSCCSAICGRSTPVAKRTLYDRYIHSLANKYQGLLDILIEDNMVPQIPFYLRQVLQLDLMTKHENLPDNLLFNVLTLNTVANVLKGAIWDNVYIVSLQQAGKDGAQYLIQLLASKLSQYSQLQRSRIRTFIETLAMSDGLREVLVPQLMVCAPLASLFTHEDIVSLWPGSEDKISKTVKRAFDVSLGADYTDINDLIWDLIHSYDARLLEKTFKCYLTAQSQRANVPKKDVIDLNSKWEGLIPIPVRNTLVKLVPEPQKGLVLIYVSKSEELTLAKNFPLALDLLNEASSIVRSLAKDSSRPCKMLAWMVLVTKIQQQIYGLPCVEENEIRNLTIESKKCLTALNNNRDVVPWTNIIHWCILLLLNAQDWASLLGVFLPPAAAHFPFMKLLKPLAATAQSLQEKQTNKKTWEELFAIVGDIMLGNTSQKRTSSGQPLIPNKEPPVMSRFTFLELVETIKEPFCLSILVSLLGHLFNIKIQDSSSSLHIDHLAMWPSSYLLMEHMEGTVIPETLTFVVDHATKLYASGAHTSTSLCSSWFLTKADLAFYQNEWHKAIHNYLTAIFVATDYLRNDNNNPDQNAMDDIVLRRMIQCCMSLNNYTQAAILCQFLENIDYNTAIRCLQERNVIDAMDAYYNCLYDVTLMEFIINMHQKKGETQRREKVMKIIGLLEINSNNNEEIQREAAKVRKHRFLRAMSKQYL